MIYHFSFRAAVTSVVFSPAGRHFAVAIGRQIEVWHTPSTPGTGEDGDLEYAPFVRHRVYTGHFDEVQSIEWSSDSRFFLSAAKDLSARIWSLDPEEGFVPTTLSGHRQSVVRAWFSKDQETIYTISKDGALFHWGYVPRPGQLNENDDEDEDMETEREMQWRITDKHYFMQDRARVTCATYHAQTNLLVAGFSNGIFGLYELPDFSTLQTLRYFKSSPTPGWSTNRPPASRRTKSTLSPSTEVANGWHSAPPNSASSWSGNGSPNPTFSSSKATSIQ